MARASADFKDAKGVISSVTTLDAKTLAEMKTYATVIQGYSDAVLSEVSVSTGEMQAAKTPAANSNVNKKGIVIVKDERGAIHKVSIPSIKTTAVDTDGESLKADVVTKIAAAVAALISKKCYGLKGYVVQKHRSGN